MAKPIIRADTAETTASGKQPWVPMKLVAVGTVAALMEAATGSVGDGGKGSMNMMVGV